MSLQVVIQNAKNVPNCETLGESDPYAIVNFQGISKQTQVVKSTLNPNWNESFEFDLAGQPLESSATLSITVKDWERVGRNRLLGKADVPLKDVAKSAGKSIQLNITLNDANSRPLTSKLSLKLSYTPPPGSQGNQGTVDQAGDTAVSGNGEFPGDGDGAETGQVVKMGSSKTAQMLASLPDKPTDFQIAKTKMLKFLKKSEKSDAESPDDVATKGSSNKDTPKESMSSSKKVTESLVVQNGTNANETSDDDGSGSKSRLIGKGKLVMDRPTNFQVRVRIVEARQLQGGNIHPVTRVGAGPQRRQTRIKKSTNSPYWNEVFFFNFHLTPTELFEEVIEFQVFNSRKLRSDALIGAFKCDIGMVYTEPQHSFINKWLLLSDPEDTMAGVKGYLKICIIVLGPGDEAPSIKPQGQDESEDIEANLLRPAGVQLRPATFILRVYRAEDIPRMDTAFLEGIKKVLSLGDEQKELVDPFLVFSFAGKKVKSKIMYGNDHPEWNQELRLGLRFPSMCEKLKFTIKDWDRLTEDDMIGTVTMPLSQISMSGENGYLPTFGPSFVNFYGSTREYSDLPDEYSDLNEGKGEGVAYRGRVLLELITQIGQMPEVAVEDISSDDIFRVQKYMRRRKFRLHAAFLNATMISVVDGPVEFEISIGNYGNKLEENIAPCASTTQPTSAVFDGCHYYFLPWGNSKPCVSFDSHWEDISYRLEGLNLVLKIIENLEANIEKIKIATRANLDETEIVKHQRALLKQLKQECSVALPTPKMNYHIPNELDRLILANRQTMLTQVVEQCTKLRDEMPDVETTMSEIDTLFNQLESIAFEPQNSMPDVVIWMISGQKRVAYYRLPANELLFSHNINYRGRQCGTILTLALKYPGKAEKKTQIPALLRIKLWLGLLKDEAEWHKMQTEGDLAVFAETYENQVNILGSWINRGPTMTRPKFSDSQGKINLAKELFVPPAGWGWEGDWYISPEMSMLYDKDSGHRSFVDDVYECQSRIPMGEWGPSSRPATDVKGDPMPPKEETELPEGWEWDDVWQTDMNRAVDEEGWEYCVEATMGGYGPVERNYHLCRRRRWLRSRTLVAKTVQKDEKIPDEVAAEGWEYAPLFNMKFHARERTVDLVRRRRWHRKMIAHDPTANCFFNMKKGDDEEVPSLLSAPRMFLTFEKGHKYHMRSYIYQARDLIAADQSGLSDPFLRVSLLNHSSVTETIERTLCPTWDQTLIFDEILINGSPEILADNPPDVIIEIFDHDVFGEPEFMGRTQAKPMVKLDPSDARPAVLQWFPIKKSNQDGGELLAAFEMFLITSEDKNISQLMTSHELPFFPPKRGDLYMVPTGIRPILQRTAIEVLCWGVRNMKKFQLANVTSPAITFECGGHVCESKVIKNTKKNPNFEEPLLFFDVLLPQEELYMPPMNICVRDHRQFGRKPAVGIAVIKSLEKYRCEPKVVTPAILPITDGQTVADVTPPAGDIAATAADVTDATDAATAAANDDAPSIHEDNETTQQLESLLDTSVSQLRRASASQPPGTGGALTAPDTVIEIDEGSEEDPEGEEAAPAEGKSKLKGFFKKIQVTKGDEGTEAADDVDLLAEDIDWWSKYYASIGETKKCRNYLEQGYDKLDVYPMELEKVLDYNNFMDFCEVYNLSRGKDQADEEEDEASAGEFKGTFRVYKLPDNPQEPLPDKILNQLPSSSPEPCVIRVYLVKAIDLQPNDSSGLADPYIQIVLGNQKRDNRDNYVPNSLNPVFGTVFELTTTIPINKDLIVRVKDYDLLTSDDVIGETVIDLENRYLSNFRATCGLAETFCSSGSNQWHDCQNPTELLKEYCIKHNFPEPVYLGNASMTFCNQVHKLSDYEKKKPKHQHLGAAEERLALHVLRTLPLVREHVETRPLYSELQPGIEQGKLQMFVNIFPKSMGPPGIPIDITQRQPKKYELRCIIWNTKDVVLDEESITGEQMSDIYVKGWITSDDKLSTDVHYRSLDGEGNFNWRFVFPFEYLPAEQSMIVKKKEHFWSLDETEQRITPTLMIQIWDNDKFSADDFLGTLALNLNQLVVPAKTAKSCNLDQLDLNIDGKKSSTAKTVNLFEQKRMRGFWPCYSDDSGQPELTGKVEMELEIITGEDAEARPAGQGREEPNLNPTLDPPKRPETSFLWFTSPWKTLKLIIWRRYKWYCIGLLVVILIILLIALFIYSFPDAIAKKIMQIGS